MTVRALIIGASAWLLVSSPARAAASASSEIEAKVALESSLEKRLESVLREVLGSKDVVVIVNADMMSEAERKVAEIMPGVPPKELPSSAAPLSVAPTLVRKLSAAVFVDVGMGEPDRELARKTVERLLGVPPEAGSVTIEATAFRKAPAADPRDPTVWAVPGAWLLFAALALLLVYARFLSPLVSLAREAAAAAKEKAPAPGAEQGAALPPAALAAPGALPALEAPLPSSASKELATEARHFSFIHERDLPALAYLLARDATSTAIVLNYLEPSLAARFLDQLPTATRQESAGLMTQTRLLNKHQVHMIEEGLRERLQYLMGGESRLAEILEGANAGVQEELLGALRERDPEAADRLSRRIIMLEDLALLEENDFKTLSRQVTVRSLAAVLAASPDLKERILPRLSGGVAEWLVQEVELCGNLPAELVEAERRRVLTALSRAVRDGKINLRKDGNDAPFDSGPAVLGGPGDSFAAETGLPPSQGEA